MNAKLIILLVMGSCSFASVGHAEDGTGDRPMIGHHETWRKDTFGPPTWRNDKGEVWKRDTFGPPTWRSNTGEVCRQDRFGGAVRCN
jgi:hypothetical protein